MRPLLCKSVNAPVYSCSSDPRQYVYCVLENWIWNKCMNFAVNEYAADSCALECKEQQEAAQVKLATTDTDGLAKLKVGFWGPQFQFFFLPMKLAEQYVKPQTYPVEQCTMVSSSDIAVDIILLSLLIMYSITHQIAAYIIVWHGMPCNLCWVQSYLLCGGRLDQTLHGLGSVRGLLGEGGLN